MKKFHFTIYFDLFSRAKLLIIRFVVHTETLFVNYSFLFGTAILFIFSQFGITLKRCGNTGLYLINIQFQFLRRLNLSKQRIVFDIFFYDDVRNFRRAL